MLRAANKNLYDCRWQSYRYYAGATSVATDEVEAIDYHHRLVRRCYLRPHPSRTLARDTFPSRGRLFSVPSVPYVDFIRSNVPGWRIGACPRPYRASPFLHPAPQGISALPFSLFSLLFSLVEYKETPRCLRAPGGSLQKGIRKKRGRKEDLRSEGRRLTASADLLIIE